MCIMSVWCITFANVWEKLEDVCICVCISSFGGLGCGDSLLCVVFAEEEGIYYIQAETLSTTSKLYDSSALGPAGLGC